MNARVRTWLVALALPLRVYLGAVFLWAAVYKIADPHAFGLSIATYDILPLSLVNLLAICLPWVEAVVGLTLIAGLWTRASALAVTGMMIMFMAALGQALAKDLQLSCGCFASAEAGDEISAGTMLRDALWLLGALYVLAAGGGRLSLDGLLARGRRRVAPGLDAAGGAG
ncbi:MAG TPA: MauE/DoxX family redox-associated membrane protein [Myxococcota bacterium]|nr:MauE/DoxX family redox-associated membrane protein [Myxococcota bacterium]HRY95754.1 MauE/DoxX family redox-associated membrane protein [Myxococcota bacterium]